MNNKGQITVFLSLIMSTLVFLGLFAVKICKYYTAKAKAVCSVNSAVSDVKSKYNSYIFEHYHILLFDKTDYGKGEAAVEEFVSENITKNLDDNQVAEYVAITEFNMLADNKYEAFKEQIQDYTAYAALDYGVDEILSKTNGKEAVIDEKMINDMDSDIGGNESDGKADGSTDEDNGRSASESESGKDERAQKSGKEKDPRAFTKTIGKYGIMYFVVPEELEVSSEVVDLSECPTKGVSSIMSIYNLNDGFNSYSGLKKDLKKNPSWNNAIIEAGCGLAYAKNVFNCAVNQEKNDDTVFKFEMEYLICGKESDYLNLKSTVKRLIALRFPVNYTYLLRDVSKMARVKEIAFSLSIATAVPEPILKYLIAGCWSYAEAVSDVRELLKGNKVEFEKNKSNWRTDIDQLKKTLMSEKDDKGKGMCYEDYLQILIALNMDNAYGRMLDIIQLNARRIYPDFLMKNAAVGMTVDVCIEGDEGLFDFCLCGGY